LTNSLCQGYGASEREGIATNHKGSKCVGDARARLGLSRMVDRASTRKLQQCDGWRWLEKHIGDRGVTSTFRCMKYRGEYTLEEGRQAPWSSVDLHEETTPADEELRDQPLNG